MRTILLTSLLATSTLSMPQMAGNFTSPGVVSGTLSCEGTSTYAFEPSTTVTITIDGEYTYSGIMNGTTPTDIYYTPPPPCSEVIVPGYSETSSSSTKVNTTTLKETTTSIETYWMTNCITSTEISNTTSKAGPYANSSIPIITSCSSTYYYRTSFSASLLTSVVASSASSTARQSFHPDISSAQLSVPKESLATSSSAEASVFISSPPTKTAVTVTVTKKTPVPASNGAPANDGPTFPGGDSGTTEGNFSPNNKISPTTPLPSGSPSPTEPTNNPGTRATTNNPNNNPNSNTNNNSNNNNNSNSGNVNNNSNNNSNRPTGSNGASNSPTNTSPPATGGSSPSPTGNGLGSIINSAFNSPWTSVGVSTSLGAASATVTLVNGVPVQVGSSSVYIGGSNVALPAGSSSAYVTINGQTFTVAPNAVIGASTTLSIERPESISYSRVQAAPLAVSTITQNGVVITVQPTAAVVSGTTFTIGLNAKETTVVVSGQTLTFNSNGVVFPSTTYKPAITTAAAYVVTTIGELTFSIDQSEAIVSGTTYRIGAGALNSVTTTVIDGTTVEFGPSGIVLPSTTIAPTSVSLTSSGSTRTTASAATRVISNTAQATSSGSAGAALSRPPIYLSNTVCVAAMLLASATLPLSLLL